jgi:hypothetical protein
MPKAKQQKDTEADFDSLLHTLERSAGIEGEPEAYARPGGRAAMSLTLSIEVVDYVNGIVQKTGAARSRVIDGLLKEAIRHRARNVPKVGG